MIQIDHIEYTELQKVISPFYSRKRVRLDVYVTGSDRVFDVECQSYSVEDIGKRMRYYQSMLDIDSLLAGWRRARCQLPSVALLVLFA